ncbi:MAG: ABC transporter substrate-binding protein, partial [Actinobacteria bacterium]|nr:ABC transporter substrate-binding protein [Actinomycetota bacterium]
MRRKWLKLFAMLLTLTLVAAACDTDEDEEGTEETEETEAEGTTAPPKKVDNLLIGQIWAESGPLAPLGPPVSEGLNLAIEDINAAGGVLGKDVDVLKGDEAGDAAKVRDAAQRLLSEGAQVIVGAMSSGMTDEIIQTLFENEIPQCSPSNTSPQFAAQENATFYFRTVPPDNAVAPVIADRVAEDGHASVAVVARADDYGKPLADLVESEAEKVGLEVTQKVTYDPDASTFDSEVDKITGDEPDAVVLISFAEGAGLIKGLLEAGMT